MSSYVQKLRESLKAKSGELDAIIKLAEEESRELTADELSTIEDMEKAIESVERSIEVAEKASQVAARASQPSTSPVEPSSQASSYKAPAAVKVDMTATQKMGLMAMSVVEAEFCKRDSEFKSPLQILEEQGFGQLAEAAAHRRKQRETLLRTLNASTNVSGGFLTPDTQSGDIIELLYPETTFLQGGPRRVPMPNGTYRQPAGASGSTASYRQEGGKTAVTEPTFKEVNLSAKFLGAIVPMTRQMIDFTLAGAQAFVEQDLREAMGQTMDAKAYFGDGDQGEPLGIVNHSGIQTVTATSAGTAPTVIQVDADFKNLRLAFWNNNIRSGRFYYVMAPRTLEYLQTMRTGDANNGQYAYPELRGDMPRMGQIPVLYSTQFPINLDTSGNANGDESDILLVNFSDVLLGTQGDMAFATSSEATIDINGAQVSAFQNDLVFLRALSAHDIGLRRATSVVRMRQLRWGA